MATSFRENMSGLGIMAVGASLMGAGLIVLGVQSLLFVRDGVWPSMSISFVWYRVGLPFPEITWSGMLNIMLWVFDQSFAGGLVVLGLLGWVSGVYVRGRSF